MSSFNLKEYGYSVRDSEKERKEAVLKAVKKHGKKAVVCYMLEFGRWEEVMLDDIVRFLKFEINDQIEEFAAFKRKHGFNSGLRVGIEERYDLKKEMRVISMEQQRMSNIQQQLLLLQNMTKKLQEEVNSMSSCGPLKRQRYV